jgi:ubiquinone/menaquinone biosynthesis C-methylase UbiE
LIERLWWRLVRFGFRLLYNEFAFTYDLVSRIVSLGAWRCWTRAALKYLPSDKGAAVLELAHGTGNLQLDLHAAGYRVVGCDLSPAMGRIAQGKLKRRGLAARLTRGRGQALPFAAGTFAAVVSTFPTDFIAAKETLSEVRRVLKDDGVFVIVPNAQLVGGGVSEQSLEWLYRITGQRGGETRKDALAALFAGFQVEVLTERCPRSVVTVIVGRKKL